MPKYVTIEKKEGETPLQALEAFRASRSDLSDAPMTYAGRLDPMASGTLLILIGDECKMRDEYTVLDKEYEFEVLFGVSSDTGDVLGIIAPGISKPLTESVLHRVFTRETVRLPYPSYSSKTVRGIPLFQYALEGRLGDIEIPETDMTIRSVQFEGMRRVDAAALQADVHARLAAIEESSVNDFRKDEVLDSWRALPSGEYTIARYTAIVSSGTYIRALAEEAGRRVGVSALAYRIHRTKILVQGKS